MTIPIIDLFAGPGGLGEGFASLLTAGGSPAFALATSIEKESSAFQTLLLRAVYRRLRGTSQFVHYIDYARGHLSRERFEAIPAIAKAFSDARQEAHQFELGRTSETEIDRQIVNSLGSARDWALIGGPPCQAYSLAGRARRANDTTFEKDAKHFLYREYLRIIRKHRPPVFVMENVKGLLSSRHSGRSTFSRILDDLTKPFDGCEYQVLSLVNQDNGLGLAPTDYLIEAEAFGIPQARHRVILLGVRNDRIPRHIPSLRQVAPVSVGDALGDLPAIRSRLSRSEDSCASWQNCLVEAAKALRPHVDSKIAKAMREAAADAKQHSAVGGSYLSLSDARSCGSSSVRGASRSDSVKEYRSWVRRPELGGFLQHETRSHMPSDLARYLFAAAYASEREHSPRLRDYPEILLPKHKNASSGAFQDRFRVQCVGEPASTVVSHIAKDGNYYIHYDPAQCRSLTVREAARLQTFPDDYLFEGNRTQQYVQVGNAVPPLLAKKIADQVQQILEGQRAVKRLAA